MQDNTEDGDEATAGRWLEDLAQGGLPQLLVGKHVSRAVGRLIAGATDIPAAAFENLAQRMRDDTKGRKRVKEAVALAAAKAAKQSPEIVEHFTQRWTGVQLRRQDNREAVGAKVLEELADDPPAISVDPGPSDDFMNFFEDLAEKASSESLRDVCAKVLAGELRKPGAFSLRTLQLVVSVMDQPLASAIQCAVGCVLGEGENKGIPILGLPSIPSFDAHGLLQDYGILRTWSRLIELQTDSNGRMPLRLRGKVVYLVGPPNSVLSFQVALLTQMGREVITLVPPPDEETSARDLAAAMKKGVPGVIRAEVGSIHEDHDGNLRVDSVFEI